MELRHICRDYIVDIWDIAVGGLGSTALGRGEAGGVPGVCTHRKLEPSCPGYPEALNPKPQRAPKP